MDEAAAVVVDDGAEACSTEGLELVEATGITDDGIALS